ncbi:dihydroxyacetone kinase subunit DhaL [Kitasatospora sp. YST-16]|uniref:dihydroxyacetone kinase subunit DhaL n=1 Tax=Kitasatospora sp. YST-16 TaxID=2998080 RepID=UPI002284E77A|nr:dihydroxyacetone kinase subunit DhaL [Kitasatospora sp. YST-16]WAL75872.1 dihydroxyacetone kinase subunit DhaL [Kitasatospora sp. YST-16]WNW41933.1 dihydroxyacetone kinase subunit DhaL [Streptomyces sp. Li-HN-5-13]
MTHETLDAALAEAWIRAAAAAVGRAEEQLTALDAAIGDGDHGSNLRRGFTAVLAALDDAGSDGSAGFDSAGALLRTVGSTLLAKVGGASGPLYGQAFRVAGAELPPDAGPAACADALAAGLAAVRALGGAEPGDKTMVDALAPAVDALRTAAAAGATLAGATAAAADAAEQGARATTPLQARRGRASYLGPRSVGHQDPGATSAALIVRALADAAAR